LEYLATTDLNISNKGNKPTFVVTSRQEVIDITLATSNIDLYYVNEEYQMMTLYPIINILNLE